MELRGTAALVTGASRGLGRETARALARRGARVVLVARGQEELGKVVRELKEELPHAEVHALAFDVGDKIATHRIAGAAAALVGPIDVLVHAASTLGPLPMPLLLDTACEDLAKVLEVNLVGPFRLTKALLGSMSVRKRGVVVFVSSDAAVSAYPQWAAYGVSKAALDQLARSFAAEVPSVRSFAFDPGEMDTKMHADAMPDADRSTLQKPSVVAERLVALLERSEKVPNGARIIASDFAKEFL